jgi:hypothetical protein
MLNITAYQKNANLQNKMFKIEKCKPKPKGISSYPHQNGYYQTTTTTKKMLGRMELLSTQCR